MGGIAFLRGIPPAFDFSPGYLISLAYLVIFGSVITMTSYSLFRESGQTERRMSILFTL
ncbi:hypothetical protein [Endozoicomonas numazuensis]|uniref:hypothetical protein n=1 Tax=Endozoicomonas numazuensis TaxID=1137799 RepID=UPI000A9DB017|nr:hypothetical protein [Endozoicomonas numazuensis]